MHRQISKLALAGPVMALAVMLTAPAAHAQHTYPIDSGRTTIILDPSFVSALGGFGLSLGTVSPSVLGNGKVTFPITSGEFDVDTATTEILHSGGLTLRSGGTKVRLDSFIIDTGAHPVVTGLLTVNNKLIERLPLFNLQFPSGLSLPLTFGTDDVIHLPAVGVTLTDLGAYALQDAFKVAIQPNTTVGTARVAAMLSVIAR